MPTKDEMLSLFDYLGKIAGKDLGKEVHQKAKAQKEKMDTKHVTTAKYDGKVMMYRREFLDTYFGKNTIDGVDSTQERNASPGDDLPF